MVATGATESTKSLCAHLDAWKPAVEEEYAHLAANYHVV